MRFRWGDGEVRKALGLPAGSGGSDLTFRGVSTDSRSVEAGDLFVALKGDNFDGHDFIARALEQGATGVVAERDVSGVGVQLY